MRRELLTSVLAAALLCAGCATSSGPRAVADPASHDPQRQVLVTVQNPSTPNLHAKNYGSGKRYGASAPARKLIAELARDYRLRQLNAWPIEVLAVHCVVFELAPGQSRSELLRMLAADPRVESVQAMQRFATLASPPVADYNDPYGRFQHSLASLQLRQAHQWTQGRGVRVALIDTGVDLRHPELAGRVSAHEDFVRASGDSFHDDVHGTAVAGVIAGATHNAEGIVSVAPRARIIALKACWPAAAGGAECNSFTLAIALAAAIARDSQVINLSLSGPPDPLLERLLRAALARGIVVVGALPETGTAARMFPTSVEGVLAASPSGRATADVSGAVFAPGVDILTTVPDAGYAFQSGSSMAAAHVSGVTALLLERRPELSASELRQLLSETSVAPAAVSGRAKTGKQAVSVNACLALIALLQLGSCADSRSPPALALKEAVQLPE